MAPSNDARQASAREHASLDSCSWDEHPDQDSGEFVPHAGFEWEEDTNNVQTRLQGKTVPGQADG